MKLLYEVKRKFARKSDRKIMRPGQFYEIADPKWATRLQERGLIGAAVEAPHEPEITPETEITTEPEAPVAMTETTEATATVEELKHVGGGWYELPDGTRIQGREEALAALAGD